MDDAKQTRLPASTRAQRAGTAFGLTVLLTVLLTACGAPGTSTGLVEWPNRAGEEIGPAIGQVAPNFTLPTATGEVLTLAEVIGEPVVLNFFASWCTSCREEMALFEETSRDGTTVVGVNLRETEEVVYPFPGSGYQYEAAEVQRCLGEGVVESPLMPHTSTLDIMNLMDTIRAEIGVVYQGLSS